MRVPHQAPTMTDTSSRYQVGKEGTRWILLLGGQQLGSEESRNPLPENRGEEQRSMVPEDLKI